MQKSILFFDIDGTILSEKTHRISESTKAAMEQARLKGHLLFINTGRTIAELEEKLLSLKVDGFVCGCGTYITYHNQILLNYELPKQLQQDVQKDIQRYRLDACLEGTEAIYLKEHSDNPLILKLRDKMLHNRLPLKDHTTCEATFTKFTIWNNEKSDFPSFYKKYKEIFTFINRGNDFFEVIPLNYSKATGIEYLLQFFHIPLDNSYAFGDSTNDLSMLGYVPNSIAMGNAANEVKAKVSFITKDVDDDGISFALNHYNLI